MIAPETVNAIEFLTRQTVSNTYRLPFSKHTGCANFSR